MTRYFQIGWIFLALFTPKSVLGQLLPQEQTQIVNALQKDLDSLEEKLKVDLNDKFSKLSAQLDENDRRVKKTLSIFEAEWTDKSKRLSDLEERQQRVEVAVMKLTKLVNEMRNPQTPTNSPPTVQQRPDFVNIFPRAGLKPVISVDDNTTKSFLLIGTQNNFKKFESIPPEEQVKLSSIQLEYVELSPAVLLESLLYCSKLKSLKLIQVKILGEFEGKVHLPQLSDFLLDQVGVLEFSNHTIFSKWSEVDDFLRGFDEGSLKSSIFFYKDDLKWNLEDISDLNTNIDLIVDGVKVFGINHDRGELNSMLRFSSDIVRNLREDFRLQKLALSAWMIDLSALPDTLTHLHFNYIHNNKEANISKANLIEKFGKLVHLKELNTFIGNLGNVSGQHQGWTWTSLPDTLKNLTIRFSDVTYDTKNSPKRLTLDNLNLHFCKLDGKISENFHKAFDSKNVAVSFRVDNRTTAARIEHQLLRNILRTNATWIFVQNFNRSRPEEKDLNDFWTVEILLLDCGVSQYAQHFILQKRNGTWEGWNVSNEGQQLLTYQLVGTDQFVTFGTYKKIIG